MLSADDWRCPTCLSMLFKPAVNSPCGHCFCFWCLHKAMSPYSPSACPICRCKYAHLPAICAKLHHFLAAQFPEDYAQRREETEAEEHEYAAASPEPPPDGPLPPPSASGHWQPQHFLCDNPACRRLLCRPAVLNCGHAVCQPTCLGAEAGPGSRQGAPAAAAAAAAAGGTAGAGAAAGGIPGPAASPGGSAPISSRSGVACECPACGLSARQPPAVCKQLSDLVQALFPEQSAQREAECQAEVAARRAQQAQQAAAAAAFAAAAEGGRQQQQQQQFTPLACSPPAAAAGAASSGHPAGEQGQADEGQSLPPSLSSALARRQEAGGPGQALAQRLEENLRRLTGDDYTWHGVGCDGCGLYPIQGPRFKCRDCPDAFGFDLCGSCMDRGLSDIVGRFNQRHTPDHRMHLVRPAITAMHLLQAANPELPMEQLLHYLEMTLQDDEEEGPAGAGQQEQGQPGGQAAGGGAAGGEGPAEGAAPAQQQQQEAGDSEMLPVLRRGPRPAYDPSAQEPSPSAFAPQQQQQQAGAAAAAAAGGEAAGMIEDGEEGGEGMVAVHVPLDRILPGGQSGGGGEGGGSRGPHA